MEKQYFYESITIETEQEIDSFLNNHKNFLLNYWDWRESLLLLNKAYEELRESTKDYGNKIDEILKPYIGKQLNDFEMYEINQKLSDIAVKQDNKIHIKLDKLSKYRYY